MKKRNNSGFTLIELLVVMAIIGILTTIAASSFISVQLKASDARRKHDLEQIQKALEMYYNDKGRYPVAGYVISGTFQDAPNNVVYMQKVPTDPRTGATYFYESNVNGVFYRLYATLENSKDPVIATSGCQAGCIQGGVSYNYRVWSPNAP